MRKFKKQALSLGMTAALALSAFGGTFTVQAEEDGASKYPETITIDVFDDLANFQGVQSGWFAKIVKDKFNMELNMIAPNVSGGGDTLYQTRSANGNLGDLIITKADQSRLKDLVMAGLLYDFSDDLENCENLKKYEDAIAQCSALAEADGMWAVPSELSNQSATSPCDAVEPTNAPSLRWDIYGEIGYPEIGTMEDLLDVLAQMQEAAGTSDSGKQVYAMSLFKDWDGDFMQNTDGLMGLYGYQNQGFTMIKADGSDVQGLLDEDGIYFRALKFLFDANQAGLIDPESTIQNYDNLSTKYKDGQVLYSFWPWLGTSQYNTSAHTAEGKGFASAIIDDMECLEYGSMPYGKMSCAIMVGSQAQDPQRMVDFIDWLYSPEGINTANVLQSNTGGPEGLAWELVDGEPKLTDFGVEAFVTKTENLEVPEEWGGGTWTEGNSTLNFKSVGLVDTDEETGMCYNYQKWEDYETRIATPLSEDWSEHNDGALNAIDRFASLDMLQVIPGSNYATPEYSTDIATIKEQVKQTIVEYSWQMVFASDEDSYNALKTEMTEMATGLGYEDVLAVDMQNAQDKIAAQEAVVAASAE